MKWCRDWFKMFMLYYNNKRFTTTKVHFIFFLLPNDLFLGTTTEPYYAETHLRDTLLSPTSLDKKLRNRLWSKASAILSNDTRIQMTQKLVHGEQHTTWEWICKYYRIFPLDYLLMGIFFSCCDHEGCR